MKKTETYKKKMSSKLQKVEHDGEVQLDKKDKGDDPTFGLRVAFDDDLGRLSDPHRPTRQIDSYQL